jgi:prolyl-tRNA synthetase
MKLDKSDFSNWYNTITKEARLCDLRYGIKGFVVFMPWAVMTMNRMYTMYEKEVESNGHVPALFPALIPEHYFTKESDHVAGFVPECFWVTQAGNNPLEERYAMRPTSETAMYTMYSLWIHGKADLPLKLYQRCQVWRYETKATKPFIRSREFHWIEAHNCFETEDDAMNQVREDMEMADNIIHNEFGIPFFFFKRPQWDKFAGAVDTYAADTLMPDGRALQLPSTHMLGQNFSKAFNIKFMDDDGQEKHVWQTCYGPAISRIYAALIATHGDDKGLVLPFRVAPVQVIIVPIFKGETQEKVLEKSKEVEELLKDYTVKMDASDRSPGYKFNEWEMKGVPIRIEIGMRDIEKGVVTLVRRDNGNKVQVKPSELTEAINKAAEGMRKDMKQNADRWFAEKTSSAETVEELQTELDKTGGFIRVPFCTDGMEGKNCADVIKEKCQANIRGSLFGSEMKPKDKCISCGKGAGLYLYAARQY